MPSKTKLIKTISEALDSFDIDYLESLDNLVTALAGGVETAKPTKKAKPAAKKATASKSGGGATLTNDELKKLLQNVTTNAFFKQHKATNAATKTKAITNLLKVLDGLKAGQLGKIQKLIERSELKIKPSAGRGRIDDLTKVRRLAAQAIAQGVSLK